MTGFFALLALASWTIESNAIKLDMPPHIPSHKMTPIRPARPHDDLYVAADTGFGMYRAPTWLGVYSLTGETDLTGASYIWRSGLEWFDNIDWHQSTIGGRFMEWNSSYIDVTAILATGESVTLTGWLDRLPGCWTDFDNWVAPEFTDQYGVTWPETQIGFDWPNMQLQSLVYRIPSAHGGCTVRTYTMHYTITCDGIEGDLGTSRIWYPWPANDGCIPAKEHNTTVIDFKGTGEEMTLTLSHGIQQVFYGKSIVPSSAKSGASDATLDVEAEAH